MDLARRWFVTRIPAALVVAPWTTHAQSPAKAYRIGYLGSTPRELDAGLLSALEEGLAEHGYVVGRNAVIEYRFARGRTERLGDLARELIEQRVDVLIAGVNSEIAAALQMTKALPIVMVLARDPVGASFVASLPKPGGNVTGLTVDVSPDEFAKNVQLLKEAVPSARRLSTLANRTYWNRRDARRAEYWRAIEEASHRLGLSTSHIDVANPDAFDDAFADASRSDACVLFADPQFFSARLRVGKLLLKHRLPAITQATAFAASGVLMAYGAQLPALYRRAAGYVDKILKGAKPSDMPVEQPSKFELAINVRTAKALGLTIPPALLVRADHLIE